MIEAGDDPVEPDIVLALSPPVPRRGFGRPVAAPPPPPPPPPSPPVPPPHPRAVLAAAMPPPVPAPAIPPPVPPAAPPAVVAAGTDAAPPGAWPDRDWWVSTAASLIVHVVALTMLALLVPVSTPDDKRPPVQIVQSLTDPEPEAFEDPAEVLPVEVVPPEPEPPVDALVDADDVPVVDDDIVVDALSEPVALDAVDSGLVATDAGDLVAAGDGGGGGGGGAAGGGFGGEIGRRLAKANAKSGDIQVSLSWNNFNDLDVHVITPSGERIFFAKRRSRCQGTLDVDMNARGPTSREAVENIYWPKRTAPLGEYQVFVHHFARHDRADETAFDVHILVNGTKRRFSGYARSGEPPVPVTRFRRTDEEGAKDEFSE